MLKELQALTMKWDIHIQERNAEQAVEWNQARATNPLPMVPWTTNMPRQNTQGLPPTRTMQADMPMPPKPNLSTRPTPNV